MGNMMRIKRRRAMSAARKSAFAFCAASLLAFGGCKCSSTAPRRPAEVSRITERDVNGLWKLFFVRSSCKYGREFYSAKISNGSMLLIGKGKTDINLLKINGVMDGSPYITADKLYVHVLVARSAGSTLFRIHKSTKEVMRAEVSVSMNEPVSIGSNRGNVYIIANGARSLYIAHPDGVVREIGLNLVLEHEDIDRIIHPVLDTNASGSVVVVGKGFKNAYIIDPNENVVKYVPLNNVSELGRPRIDINDDLLCILPDEKSDVICINGDGEVQAVLINNPERAEGEI